jgi:tetratricopeptide (TPR) repeat protein
MRLGLAVVTIAVVLSGAALAGEPASATDAALRAFRAGRFDELEQRLSDYYALRHGTRSEATRFGLALQRTAKAIDLDPALRRQLQAWKKAVPKSARPWVVEAHVALREAWRARGSGGYASSVSKDAWRGFYERVSAADELLAEAARIAPRDPAAAEMRIETALLGPGGLEPIVARFEAAIEIDPASEYAHRLMHRAMLGRWHGDDKLALAFVREAVRRQPQQPALAALLIDAHEYVARGGGKASPQAISMYFREQKVWSECLAALERYVSAHPTDPWGRNRLAWLAWRGGRRDIARREFAALDGDILDEMWDGEIAPEQAILWARSEPAPAAHQR